MIYEKGYFVRFILLLHMILKLTYVLLSTITNFIKLDFCLSVHHQSGKVIQMNQLHATMIY